VLKRSAATGKINVLTTSHTITHRRTDELGNMLFKNKTGKIASLMNYNKSQRDVTDDDDFRKNTTKVLLFSILRCNLLKRRCVYFAVSSQKLLHIIYVIIPSHITFNCIKLDCSPECNRRAACCGFQCIPTITIFSIQASVFKDLG